MDELHVQTFSFYVMVISSCAVFAILMLFTILSRTFRRMLQNNLLGVRRGQILECIDSIRELSFPMMVMLSTKFNVLGRMTTFEEAGQQSLLVSLYSIDAIQKFLATQPAIIIFISHQWLAWIEPDASGSRSDFSCKYAAECRPISPEEGAPGDPLQHL